MEKNLEVVSKGIENYLEMKRLAFPRFYFLANEELLDILAHLRDPSAVQTYLKKCFESKSFCEFVIFYYSDINQLDFVNDSQYQVITAMISAEGERVELGRSVRIRGNVEDWLKSLEQRMFKVIQEGFYYAYMVEIALSFFRYFRNTLINYLKNGCSVNQQYLKVCVLLI